MLGATWLAKLLRGLADGGVQGRPDRAIRLKAGRGPVAKMLVVIDHFRVQDLAYLGSVVTLEPLTHVVGVHRQNRVVSGRFVLLPRCLDLLPNRLRRIFFPLLYIITALLVKPAAIPVVVLPSHCSRVNLGLVQPSRSGYRRCVGESQVSRFETQFTGKGRRGGKPLAQRDRGKALAGAQTDTLYRDFISGLVPESPGIFKARRPHLLVGAEQAAFGWRIDRCASISLAEASS